jgi:cell division protein FtsW
MAIQQRADYVFLTYVAVFLVFGLVALTSASSAIGIERFGDSYFFIKRQLLYGLVPGIFAFLFFSKLNYSFLRKHAGFVYVLCISLLILVFVPGIGSSLNTGSTSWLVFGNFSFQPAEFAKLGLIIFMAAYLSKKQEAIKTFQSGFLVALILGMVPIVLVIFQPDIGTVAILFVILFGLLFVGEAKLGHLGLLAAAGVTLFAIMIISAPYRAERFTTFLHPELDPQGVGYQINQSLIAIGSGGIFGLGLGHSRQKFQYLPEVHADSIFAVIAEEMGFIITVGFLILLALIAMRGFMIAKHAPDMFGRILVSGIMIWFLAQSFLNIGAMVGMLPLTGVPLLFVSHGGTAFVLALAAVGIVVNVSKHMTYNS